MIIEAELEKVLVHYKNDSLKLLAAKFLIENMPAYYTYKGTLLDSMYIALAQYADSSRYDEHRFCLPQAILLQTIRARV